MLINSSTNKTLDDSVIEKNFDLVTYLEEKEIVTDQNECTKMRIGFDC